MLEFGLKGDVPVSESSDKSIPEQVIAVLGKYKAAVDSFFLEERKGIYQKYAFGRAGVFRRSSRLRRNSTSAPQNFRLPSSE